MKYFFFFARVPMPLNTGRLQKTNETCLSWTLVKGNQDFCG